MPEETDIYTVGQADLRYKEGHFGTVYTDELEPSEPLNVANGGTGASTAEDARANLGLDDIYKQKRTAWVGSDNTAAADCWCKFAEITTKENYVDPAISFKVRCGYYGVKSVPKYVGILTAHARSNSSGVPSSIDFIWEYAEQYIDTSKFVFAYSGNTIELWVKLSIVGEYWWFEVLSEGDRYLGYKYASDWTLYQSNSISSDITEGYTQVISTLGTLQNDTTGSAAAAAALKTARTIQTNLASTSSASFDGTANITPGVTGVLPLTNGGTGSSTAEGARTSLGLGAAALKSVDTAVTSGSANLITSGGVYDAIEEASKRTHIVIASYDTLNPLKANADYTCTSTDASDILTQALSEIKAGGKIELLDGTYNMQWNEAIQGNDEVYSVDINLANVTIEGSGWGTVINQCQDGDETMAAFRISAKNVTLKNFMITSVSVGSPYPMIIQTAEAAAFENIFFVDNVDWASYSIGQTSTIELDYGCIKGFESCPFTRILNCRVYKLKTAPGVYMFNYGACTNFSGVVGGNISNGNDEISVLFASETHQNNTAIYGHTEIDTAVYA